jgi:hypothetical protein
MVYLNLSIKTELGTSKFDLDHGMSMKDMNWRKAAVTQLSMGCAPSSGELLFYYLRMHTSSGSEVLSSRTMCKNGDPDIDGMYEACFPFIFVGAKGKGDKCLG